MVRHRLRGLGLADGERGEEAKAQLGESPGDHALWRADHLAVMSVSYAERGGSDSLARYQAVPSTKALDSSTALSVLVYCASGTRGRWASGCSEVVSRAVRDRETGGSIPLTPTTMDTRARWRHGSEFDSRRVHDGLVAGA